MAWRRRGDNARIMLIERLGTNFSEILIEIRIFSFKKVHLKMPSAKWRPFCLGLNVLMNAFINFWGNISPLLLRHFASIKAIKCWQKDVDESAIFSVHRSAANSRLAGEIRWVQFIWPRRRTCLVQCLLVASVRIMNKLLHFYGLSFQLLPWRCRAGAITWRTADERDRVSNYEQLGCFFNILFSNSASIESFTR